MTTEAEGSAGAFVEAAAGQLVRGARVEDEARSAVLRLLNLVSQGAASGAGQGEAAELLAADPLLLSVVFQNADLLFAHAWPPADALALAVMEALARLHDPSAPAPERTIPGE